MLGRSCPTPVSHSLPEGLPTRISVSINYDIAFGNGRKEPTPDFLYYIEGDGAGGLIINDLGKWMIGKVLNIGKATNVTAELWGISKRTKLRGIQRCSARDGLASWNPADGLTPNFNVIKKNQIRAYYGYRGVGRCEIFTG